jgi:hypothetical protein
MKTAMDSKTSSISLVTKVLLELPIQNTRVLDTMRMENGEIPSEPLNIFGKDNPVTCAVYAREHGLLEEEGWKRFKGIAKREKKMLHMVNQLRIKATHNAPRTSLAIVSLTITMGRCNLT